MPASGAALARCRLGKEVLAPVCKQAVTVQEERHVFGGVAQTAYDPCYHQACDTVDNCNPEALGSLAKAAADVMEQMVAMPNLRAFLQQEKDHYTQASESRSLHSTPL